MKKIYTIKITSNNSHPNIWYAKRIGQEFKAEISDRWWGYGVFLINTRFKVYPEDCEVLSVREEEKYFRDSV